MLPFVSVILAVRNERAMLPRLLDDLLRQNYPPDRFEILVVDGRSSDGTPDLVRRRYTKVRTPVRVIESAKANRAAGRNAGIQVAAGDVLLFIDGHCRVPSQNLLEDTVAILESTGADCLARPEPLLAPSATDTGETIARVRGSRLGRRSTASPEKAAGFVDPRWSGAAYRRRVFERVGLYDESFDCCEVLEFNTRIQKAGLRAYSDPRLAVHYRPQARVRDLLREMVATGRGRMRLMRRHREALSAMELAPLGVLLSLALAIPAWFLLPVWGAALVTLPAALFVAAAITGSVQVSMRHGLEQTATAALAYGAIYTGMGAGLLLEGLRPGTRREREGRLEVVRPAARVEEMEESERAA